MLSKTSLQAIRGFYEAVAAVKGKDFERNLKALEQQFENIEKANAESQDIADEAAKREKSLAAKMRKVSTMEKQAADLTLQKEDIAAAQRSLDAREAELSDRAVTVQQTEKDARARIAGRRKELDKQMSDLAVKESLLTAKELDLNTREATIQQREDRFRKAQEAMGNG